MSATHAEGSRTAANASKVRTAGAATIVAGMSMSVDGFVAGPSDEVDRLFAWYANLSEASGILLQEAGATLRAIINGRRTFDIAGGWGGKHPLGVPVSWPRILRQPQGTPIELDGSSSRRRERRDAPVLLRKGSLSRVSGCGRPVGAMATRGHTTDP